MPADADFSKLKAQVEEADQRIRASAAQGVDELKEMVDEARNNADARAAELSTKAQEAGDKAEAHWNQVQSDSGPARQADPQAHRCQEGRARRRHGRARRRVGRGGRVRGCPVRAGRHRRGGVRRAGRCAGQERRGRTRCREVARRFADFKTLSAPQGALSFRRGDDVGGSKRTTTGRRGKLTTKDVAVRPRRRGGRACGRHPRQHRDRRSARA